MRKIKYLDVPGFSDRHHVIAEMVQLCKDGVNHSKDTTWFLGTKHCDQYRPLLLSNTTHKQEHVVGVSMNSQQAGVTAYAPHPIITNYPVNANAIASIHQTTVMSLTGGSVFSASPNFLNSISYFRSIYKR